MKVEKQHIEAVWKFLYEGLKAHYEQGAPFHEALDMIPLNYTCLTDLARYMQEPLGRGIAHDDFLLDAVHRLECFIGCPAFDECPLEECDGRVFCKAYNGGYNESHGSRVWRERPTREEHKQWILDYFRKRGELPQGD